MPYRIINAGAYLDNQVKAGSISREDADLIHGFCEERKATNNVSESTALATSKGLAKFAIRLAPFKECSTQDIIKAINAVRTEWKQNTQRLRVFYLTIFAKWLAEEGHNTKIDLKKMNSIKLPKADKVTKTPSQMISEEMIDFMIKSRKNMRDRALIAFMYEGALRPIEVREATWEQIKFDDYGAIYTTAKKTGKPRYIRLIKYAGYLAAWKANYPGTPEGDAPVFITNRGGEMSRQYFHNIIASAAKDAGLKDVFPYIIRHSRITAMVAQEIPESVIKLQAWGNLSTPMMATYTHLQDSQIDDILLGKAGIKRIGRPKGQTIKPVQCPSCDHVNVPGSRYCSICGRSLSEDARATQADTMTVIRDLAKRDPEGLVAALKNI